MTAKPYPDNSTNLPVTIIRYIWETADKTT